MARSRIRSHDGEDEPLWQVVYIDFLTMMMTLFMIFAFTEKLEGIGNTVTSAINLPGDNSFASGDDRLKPDMQKALREYFTGMHFDSSHLWIIGHTDDVGNRGANYSLAFRRAAAVYNQLVSIEPSYAKIAILCAAADNNPVKEIAGGTDKARQGPERALLDDLRKQNRRIEIERKDKPDRGEKATAAGL